MDPAALAAATKQNLTDFFRFLARSPVAEYWEDDGCARWRTPLVHPWFNGVLLRRPPRLDDRALLAQLLAVFDQNDGAQSTNPAPFTVWREPGIAYEPWAPVFAALGLRHDTGAPGMVLEFSALPGAVALPPGLTVQRVADDAALRLWADTFMAGYELPAAWADGFYALMAGLGLEFPLTHYLGCLDGAPVATSSLFYSAGVAGVQFVATLPHARRRGLGGAMTLHPLYDAQRLGYRAAILQSSDMGYPVYAQLGFKHVANVDNEYRPAPIAAHAPPGVYSPA